MHPLLYGSPSLCAQAKVLGQQSNDLAHTPDLPARALTLPDALRHVVSFSSGQARLDSPESFLLLYSLFTRTARLKIFSRVPVAQQHSFTRLLLNLHPHSSGLFVSASANACASAFASGGASSAPRRKKNLPVLGVQSFGTFDADVCALCRLLSDQSWLLFHFAPGHCFYKNICK